MSARRLLLVFSGCVAAGAVSLAQVGRGGSQWLAPLGDAHEALELAQVDHGAILGTRAYAGRPYLSPVSHSTVATLLPRATRPRSNSCNAAATLAAAE